MFDELYCRSRAIPRHLPRFGGPVPAVLSSFWRRVPGWEPGENMPTIATTTDQSVSLPALLGALASLCGATCSLFSQDLLKTKSISGGAGGGGETCFYAFTEDATQTLRRCHWAHQQVASCNSRKLQTNCICSPDPFAVNSLTTYGCDVVLCFFFAPCTCDDGC